MLLLSSSQILTLSCVATHNQYLFGLKHRAWIIAPTSSEYNFFPSFKSHSSVTTSLPPLTHSEPSGRGGEDEQWRTIEQVMVDSYKFAKVLPSHRLKNESGKRFNGTDRLGFRNCVRRHPNTEPPLQLCTRRGIECLPSLLRVSSILSSPDRQIGNPIDRLWLPHWYSHIGIKGQDEQQSATLVDDVLQAVSMQSESEVRGVVVVAATMLGMAGINVVIRTVMKVVSCGPALAETTRVPPAGSTVVIEWRAEVARVSPKVWETAHTRILRQIDELDLKITCACPHGRYWLVEKLLTVLDCLRGFLSLAETIVCDAS
ncbi:hypothetical protein Sjap_004910 [Stephania japonica]|uniref:Uncharacterized protein n=1 Tax=Stephania japonica TaxID=461633 RepID=A0AAP0K5C7_9MAGN